MGVWAAGPRKAIAESTIPTLLCPAGFRAAVPKKEAFDVVEPDPNEVIRVLDRLKQT